MESSRIDVDDARASLAQVQVGRRAAARRVVTPWWYHPLLGLALAATIGSLSLRGPAFAVVLLAAVLAQAALLALYRRLTGLWLNTWHVPQLRRATGWATAVGLGVAGTGLALEDGAGLRGAAAVAGVVSGILYVLFWRWVDRRLAELWSQPQ